MATLVVMAGGLATRYGSLKQMAEVGLNKEFIIDYSVYDAIRVGFKKVVFIVREEIKKDLEDTIGKRIKDKIDVEFVLQKKEDIPLNKQYLVSKRTKPWGTVQAILAVKDVVQEDFLIINADDFYGYDSFLKAKEFLDKSKDEKEYASVNFPFGKSLSKNGAVKRAVCHIKDNYVQELIESRITLIDENNAKAEPLDGSAPFRIDMMQAVSVNMLVVKKSIFRYLEEYFKANFNQSDEDILNKEALLTECLNELLKKKKIVLKNLVSEGTWLGLTYKEDLPEVQDSIKVMIERGEYPSKLWE